jgi:DNA invertase Pin-like site-specific DNA recombinase
MMLTVLGGLAEFERELIRARTDEGMSSRQGEWHPHGRPSKRPINGRRLSHAASGRTAVRHRSHVWRRAHYDRAAAKPRSSRTRDRSSD